MNVSEQIRIPAPLADIWPLLSDPALVASCIPGAQLAPDQGDGVWRGSIRVRFGPTAAAFRGEATLDYDHGEHRCTIAGRGIDQRGASRALSSGVILASADGGETMLKVDGSFTVTGPLESFANAGGVHVARVLLAEFATNIAAVVAERRGAIAPAAEPRPEDGGTTPPPESAAPAPPPRPAREIGALSLLWRAFTSWLTSLFRERTR
jgi:carbon monoxide dehydrogenase subunit G